MSNLLHLLPLAFDAGHPPDTEIRTLREPETPVAEPLPAPLPAVPPKPVAPPIPEMWLRPPAPEPKHSRVAMTLYAVLLALVLGAAWDTVTTPATTMQASCCPVPQDTP